MTYALILAVVLVAIAAGKIAWTLRRRRFLPCGCRVEAMRELATFGRQVTCPHRWWWSEHPDAPTVLTGAPRRPHG